MYLPGFPDIAKDLKTTTGEVALSLSSFFIGISVGQFLYGPLLDRFGRKKPLYAGVALYLVASACCAMARSVELLIILRLFQAIGACACLVASRALVRDLFPVEENAKIFSQLMLVIAVLMLKTRSRIGLPDVQMSWDNTPAIVGLGLATGTLSGFFGIGGGFLIVPALMLATGMPIMNAVSSSLVAVTAFGLTTAASYAWSGLISWELAGAFIAGGVAGGLIGTRSARLLSVRGGALNMVFAAVIIAVALYMLARNLSLS